MEPRVSAPKSLKSEVPPPPNYEEGDRSAGHD
jgi:hypothetical protein